jgi:hypothetical protein
VGAGEVEQGGRYLKGCMLFSVLSVARKTSFLGVAYREKEQRLIGVELNIKTAPDQSIIE